MKKMLIGLLTLAVLVPGCMRRQDERRNPLMADEYPEQIVMILLDFSGSFEPIMAEAGWEYCTRAIGKYFQDRAGTSDRMIIGQISATKHALVWEGPPDELRRSFGSASEFREFMAKRADPNASLVNDGVSHALTYMMNTPGVRKGKTRMVCLVLSDLLDNASDPQDSEQRLKDVFHEFGQQGGIIGLYYLDQFDVGKWDQVLADAGIRNRIVESNVAVRPPLPSFDE